MKQFLKKIYDKRIQTSQAKLLKDVKALCGSAGAITLLDIGSAGGVEPRWQPLKPHLNYIGVEPDNRSYVELMNSSQNENFSSYQIIPQAVWEHAGQIRLNLCRKPTVSSHFNPRTQFVRKFPMSDRFDVLKTQEITCDTIDNLAGSNKIDFIKLDIQGGELAVLKGARKTLKRCFGLEIEVEFLQLYNGQPLFGEICAYLETIGIEFVDFTSFNRWERQVYRGLGQCVFGDALFLKSPENVIGDVFNNALLIEDLKLYLAILRIYNRPDLMCQVFNESKNSLDKNFLNLVETIIKKNEKNLFYSLKMTKNFTRMCRMFYPEQQFHLMY